MKGGEMCSGSLMVMLASVAVGACAGAPYEPVQSPRISMVTNGYVRDGRKFEDAGFGGGLVEATAGNARATRKAEQGRGLVVGGFVVSVVGLTAEATGVALMATSLDRDERGQMHFGSRGNVGLVVGLSGIATTIVGSVLMGNGRQLMFDAVNMYNDDATRPQVSQPPPGQAPQPQAPAQAPPPAQTPPPAPAAPPAQDSPPAQDPSQRVPESQP